MGIGWAAQCAMCKDGLVQSSDVPGQVSTLAYSFNLSIYLMLGLVFGIMGVIAFFVARMMRREEARLVARPAQNR